MVCSIVIYEKLRGHLRVEEGAKDRVFLALHSCNEGSTIRLGHVRYGCGSEHSLKASVTCELLRWNTPVMPIVSIVMVFEEEGNVLQLPEHL
jgi:hypothetical protein